jgi:hypothetical protein
VARVDEYIEWTLYGVKADVATPPLRSLQDPADDGVRMTMFYYPIPPPGDNHEHMQRPDTVLAPRHRMLSGQVLLGIPPPAGTSDDASGRWQADAASLAALRGFPFNYTEQDKCGMPVSGPIWCMTELLANQTYRAYNYPHQTAVYWAMYRVARHYDGMVTFHVPTHVRVPRRCERRGLWVVNTVGVGTRQVTRMSWAWYLERAFKTAMKIGSPNVGLMDGTVFRELLLALHEEAAANATMASWATQLEQAMRKRAEGWAAQTFPYGSEVRHFHLSRLWSMFTASLRRVRGKVAWSGYMLRLDRRVSAQSLTATDAGVEDDSSTLTPRARRRCTCGSNTLGTTRVAVLAVESLVTAAYDSSHHQVQLAGD